jgi:hypothetical protein
VFVARALFRQILQRTPLQKPRLANSISQGVRRSPPDGGTPEFLPYRFQIFQFAAATLTLLKMQLQANESAASNSPSKKLAGPNQAS